MEEKNAFNLRFEIDRICGVGPIPESQNSEYGKPKEYDRVPRRGRRIRSIKKCWKW